MLLEVNRIQKYYGEGEARNLVLDQVDLSVDAGEICIIMGPSGSGKSTLLHCIGGLETIDGGSICVDGNELTKLNNKELANYRRASIGFVFQFYNLVPNLTVAENVDVCGYLSKSPLNRDELLELLGLADKRNAFPRTLSGGEQQRCAIARALVKNPKLLLCDEPTGALDSKNAREILCLLDKVNKELGTTILMVTHNDAIKPMANHILTLRDGRVTDNHYNKKRLAAAKLGDI